MATPIISAITTVWTAIFTWIISSIQSLIPIFWTEGSGDTAGKLTFLGVLAIIALGVGLFFLIMGVIQNFLHLRG